MIMEMDNNPALKWRSFGKPMYKLFGKFHAEVTVWL